MRSEIDLFSSLLRRFPQLLAVGITLMAYLIATDCAAALSEVTRNVGENLIFHCTNDTQRELKFLYWQKGAPEVYVNGFHSTNRINNTPWENTTVDPEAGAVHMNNLNVSHEGIYTCHIMFTDSAEEESIKVQLRVTAPYSNISHSEQCDKENHTCQVTCWGHGGHPSAQMEFNLTGSNSENRWTVVNSSEERDPNTLLFSSSRTTLLNCTGGELKFSCSVGGTTSEVISVCGGPQSTFDYIVVIAISAAVFIPIVSLGTAGYIWKRKCGKSKTITENGKDPEENIALNQKSAAS